MERVLLTLKEEGIETEESPISPNGLRLVKGKITNSSFFKNGDVTIQDESSQLVALFGKLRESDQVLDACAAPGGKTVHMASYLKDGHVHALDIHDHKIGLIEENAKRMNVSDRVQTYLLDAKEADRKFDAQAFDVVFVDAPCSGLGLMRRKPEIKYGVTATTINDLQKEQLNILNTVEKLVKTGGRLVYSTCTLAKEENREVIETFLTHYPNYRVLPANQSGTASKNVAVPEQIVTSEGYIQIFPDDFGTDGFFICVMEKQD